MLQSVRDGEIEFDAMGTAVLARESITCRQRAAGYRQASPAAQRRTLAR
jgi:hypothetical protein